MQGKDPTLVHFALLLVKLFLPDQLVDHGCAAIDKSWCAVHSLPGYRRPQFLQRYSEHLPSRLPCSFRLDICHDVSDWLVSEISPPLRLQDQRRAGTLQRQDLQLEHFHAHLFLHGSLRMDLLHERRCWQGKSSLAQLRVPNPFPHNLLDHRLKIVPQVSVFPWGGYGQWSQIDQEAVFGLFHWIYCARYLLSFWDSERLAELRLRGHQDCDFPSVLPGAHSGHLVRSLSDLQGLWYCNHIARDSASSADRLGERIRWVSCMRKSLHFWRSRVGWRLERGRRQMQFALNPLCNGRLIAKFHRLPRGLRIRSE